MQTYKPTWVDRLESSGAEQEEALLELHRLLSHRITAALRTGHRVDSNFVEDIVQESLIKILVSLEQFEGRSQFTTWATTIAIRIAYTELRKRQWKDVSLDEMIQNPDQHWVKRNHDIPPDSTAEFQQLERDLQRLIDTELTQRQRDALLAELSGVPLEEIGRRSNSNRNAVYKLTHDARKKLRRALERLGYSATEFFRLLDKVK